MRLLTTAALFVLAGCGPDSGSTTAVTSAEEGMTKPPIVTSKYIEELPSDDRPHLPNDVMEVEGAMIRLLPSSRISLALALDADVASALNTLRGRDGAISNIVTEPCVRKLRELDKSIQIFAPPGRVPNDGNNILLTLRVGPNAQGTPYRITLHAMQGNAQWSATIERKTFRNVGGSIPILPGSRTSDGVPYWEPITDAHALGQRLCRQIFDEGFK